MQIHSSTQLATLAVNTYPKPVDPGMMMELVAQKHGEPTVAELSSSSGVDDLQHAANWETVTDYIQTVDASNFHEHCPFLQREVNTGS